MPFFPRTKLVTGSSASRHNKKKSKSSFTTCLKAHHAAHIDQHKKTTSLVTCTALTTFYPSFSGKLDPISMQASGPKLIFQRHACQISNSTFLPGGTVSTAKGDSLGSLHVLYLKLRVVLWDLPCKVIKLAGQLTRMRGFLWNTPNNYFGGGFCCCWRCSFFSSKYGIIVQ